MILKTIGAVVVALILGAVAGGWWMHGHVAERYQAKLAALQVSVDSAKDVIADQRAKVVASQKEAKAQKARANDAWTAVEASAHKAQAMNATFAKRLADAKAYAASKVCPPVLEQHLPPSIGTDY